MLTNVHLQLRVKEWRDRGRLLLRNAKPMDKKLAESFMTFCISEQKMLADVDSFTKDLKTDRGWLIAMGRVAALDLEISVVVVTFIVGYLVENPGGIVLYLTYLKAVQNERKHFIDMKEFAFIFPDGFFSENDQEELWRLQKLTTEDRKQLAKIQGCTVNQIYGDNLLDRLELFRLADAKKE